ncbi:MAG: sigma factor, partial [Telluria sp.]
MLHAETNAADAFTPIRPRLVRIAYRMLGSIGEAEDVVQDAYLRWHQADRDTVRVAEAFLVRTVTRLCLDVLKSARIQR